MAKAAASKKKASAVAAKQEAENLKKKKMAKKAESEVRYFEGACVPCMGRHACEFQPFLHMRLLSVDVYQHFRELIRFKKQPEFARRLWRLLPCPILTQIYPISAEFFLL